MTNRAAKANNRAFGVSYLLQCGWSPRAVAIGLKIIDETGDVGKAMEAMKKEDGRVL